MVSGVNEKSNQSNKPRQSSSNGYDNAELMEMFQKLHSDFRQLSEDLDLCIQVNRIVIELLGGIKPGRKNLDGIQLVKLRNEGVKVKDLAMMQGISECAMSRKLKELREVGILRDGTVE